tara:strand:- start:34419 stop:34538 length:120 start_codon:yes stop_codon:yes gene_type:complete
MHDETLRQLPKVAGAYFFVITLASDMTLKKQMLRRTYPA